MCFSESFIKNEQASSSANSNVVCENGVCRRVSPTAEAGSSQSSSSQPVQQQLSTEEKVEKAKELIEKKREQKELEEKEVSIFVFLPSLFKI